MGVVSFTIYPALAMLKFVLLFLGAVLVVYVITNLDAHRVGGPLSPPFTVTYRDSYIGQGVVMNIANRSEATLYGARVRIEGRDGHETSAEVTDALKPGENKEVGWRELHHWTLEAGEQISLYASGYPAPFKTSCQPSGQN